MGGHGLNGKTIILHIVISGSSPDVSMFYLSLVFSLRVKLILNIFNKISFYI